MAQTCPNVTYSASFSSKYNHKIDGSYYGKEGKNYHCYNGGDSWIKYGVQDDPVGIAQLKTATLTQKFKATKTTYTKKIHSCYVHTWKSMACSMSVSGSAGQSGGKPSYGISITAQPSIKDKSWPLYNFVSFDW